MINSFYRILDTSIIMENKNRINRVDHNSGHFCFFWRTTGVISTFRIGLLARFGDFKKTLIRCQTDIAMIKPEQTLMRKKDISVKIMDVLQKLLYKSLAVVLLAGIMLLVVIMFVAFLSGALKGFDHKVADWNEDGQLSIEEFFLSLRVNQRELADSEYECDEYYIRSSNLTLKIICTKPGKKSP